MKISKYETIEEWFEARVGKITGSRVKDIIVKRGTEMKIGYYELIAERLSLPADDENPMDRGTRLEEFAIEEFVKATGKKVNTDLVIWERDDNDRISVSPDGSIVEEDGTVKEVVVVATMGTREAVEAKCLKSSHHMKAFLTQEIPSEYEDQAVQYFVVNDDLETLYFAFYDPRLLVNNFFYLTLTRESMKMTIDKYLADQRNILDNVEAVVTRLTAHIF